MPAGRLRRPVLPDDDSQAPRSTLVLGGASSGKSAFAERLVLQLPGRPVYIATAEAFDAEMAEKIDAHKARRGGEWINVEEPLDLRGAMTRADADDAVLLVDCLTLWLSNLLTAGRDVDSAIAELVDTMRGLRGKAVFVGNELGLGIVPDNAVARAFRNQHGAMNQTVAAAADRVVFVAAGMPLVLKGEPG